MMKNTSPAINLGEFNRDPQLFTAIGLPFALFGLFVALMPPVLVAMALKVNEISSVNSRAADLGIILSIGAFFATISNPIFGRLSDRTTGRFGMRRPWIIAGCIGGYLGLVIITTANSIEVVTIGWGPSPR